MLSADRARRGLAELPGRSIAGLALALVAVQFVVHVWHAASGAGRGFLMPHLVAWIQDSFVLCVVASVGCGAVWLVGGCGRAAGITALGSSAVLAAAGVALGSYPRLVPEFLLFPVDLFQVDAQAARFFVTQYLGWGALLPPLMGVAIALVLCRRLGGLVSRKRAAAWMVPAGLLTFASLGRPAPQPLVYSFQQSVKARLIAQPRRVPPLGRPVARSSPAACPAAAALPRAADLRYRHVLVLTLETVNAADFERELLAKAGGYFSRICQRSVYFPRYYTTNLDSYTSLICMLTSVQVPYRCYADPGLYEAVNRAPNLVRSLRERGFQTLFISTSEHLPFVPVRNDWNKIISRRGLPPRRGYASVESSKIEAATEDLAALPAVVDFLQSHPRTFVLQEFVFGHSPQWASRTGQPQLAYYDRYLRTLLDGLEEANLEEETLIVVVADHGMRSDASDPEHYRVPLLISGVGIPRTINRARLSHVQFQAIVGHYLGGLPCPQESAAVLVVGASDRWVYGEIGDAGYQFIENDSGVVLRTGGKADPQSLHLRFQALLDAFASRCP